MKLSIITTCKGRLDHLKQTLPRMVEQGDDVEVIVVDYDCPDGTAAWVTEHYPQVRVVKIADAPVFSASKARNLGAAEAAGDWLLFIDADTLIPADFVSKMYPLLNEGSFYHPLDRHPNVYGTFICARADFLELEGYDEVMRPWGGEDRDIYYRLRHFMNRTNPGFPGEWLKPILHSDADRMRFTETTDIAASQRANTFYLIVKYDLIRLAGKSQLSLKVRQHLYETIRSRVLANASSGVALTQFMIDATDLPGYKMASGWKAKRTLLYDLFPEGVDAQEFMAEAGIPASPRPLLNSAAAARESRKSPGRNKAAGHIAMFHLGRSGSTVLGNLLDQHPAIEWDGEIYEPRGRFYHKHGFSGDAADPLGFLNKRLAGAAKPSYGFEIKPYHTRLVNLTTEKLITSLDALGFTHFVLLRRRNSLRKVVSSLVGRNAMRMHVPAGSAVPLTKIHLNVNEVSIDHTQKPLLQFLREYEADMRDIECRLGGRNLLKLSYEDDLRTDPQAGYRKVCEFLGVSPAQAETRLGRTTPFPLSEVIENHDEVAAALRGTEFEWMINDDE